jgi:hypothetical protein
MNPLIAKLKSWSWLGVGIGLVYAVIFGILFLLMPAWLSSMPMLPSEFVMSGVPMFILGMIAYVVMTAVLWALAGLVSYVTVPLGSMFLSRSKFYAVHLWLPYILLSLVLTVLSGTLALVPFAILAGITLVVLYVMLMVLKLFKWTTPSIS